MNFTAENQSFAANMSLPVLQCSNISDAWPHIACGRCLYQNDVHHSLLVYHRLQPIFAATDLIVSVVSLLGNFLVILTVLTHIHNRTMTDLFLFNIAVVDLFFSGVNVVGECLSLIQNPKSLQESCISQPLTSLRVFTFTVSIFSLTALSLERLLFTSIYQISNNLKTGLLFMIWVSSLALTVPLGFCANRIDTLYSISLAVLILTLPLMATIMFNYLIWKSANTQIGPATLETRSKMTVAMVTGLLVSLVTLWIPYLVVAIYPEVFGNISTCVGYGRLLVTEKAVCLVAFLNPALNPVLFGIFSNYFREGFKRIFRLLCSCCFEPLP